MALTVDIHNLVESVIDSDGTISISGLVILTIGPGAGNTIGAVTGAGTDVAIVTAPGVIATGTFSGIGVKSTVLTGNWQVAVIAGKAFRAAAGPALAVPDQGVEAIAVHTGAWLTAGSPIAW